MPQSFRCLKCGNCCRIPGAVHLADEEIQKIAKYLGMDLYDFTEKFTEISPSRGFLALANKKDGSCAMLTDSGLCAINDVKPVQCRNFPFTWHNADSAKTCPALAALEAN